MKTRKEQMITHKVRRYQQDAEAESDSGGACERGAALEIPASVTIEAAISFFDENARDEYASLYKRTAAWLRELHRLCAPKKPAEAGSDAVRQFLKNRADALCDEAAEKDRERES